MAEQAPKPPETEDEFFLQAGVNPEVVRANEGTPNADQLALLKEKHGTAVVGFFLGNATAKAELAKAKARDADNSRAEAVKDLFKDYDVTDTDKLFNEMREWAKENYSPEEYAELQADTKRGGRAQKAALREIADGYVKANPLSVKVKGAVDGDTTTPTNPNYITSAEYVDKLKALQKQGKGNESKEVKALNAQRMASRNIEQKQ